MTRPIRLLFLNAYLLWVLRLPGGIQLGGKPGLAARAREIGAMLARDYDIAALCEVFNRAELDAILSGWSSPPDHVLGPGKHRLPVFGKPSGLVTLADGLRIMRTDRYAFRTRGSRLRDTDALSDKGVLLAEIDVGAGDGRLEVYSTHLIMGNDLWRRPGTLHRANSRVRFEQVDELLDFVERTHDPANVALVVGDFNIPAHDPLEPEHPTSDYVRLRTRFDADGFDDLWRLHGEGPGYTYGLDHVGDRLCRDDPERPGFCVEPVDEIDHHKPLRIDYAFLQRPRPRHEVRVTVQSFRRRSFPRPAGAEHHEQLGFLSDHLGLHLDLAVEAVRATERRPVDG